MYVCASNRQLCRFGKARAYPWNVDLFQIHCFHRYVLAVVFPAASRDSCFSSVSSGGMTREMREGGGGGVGRRGVEKGMLTVWRQKFCD